MNSLHVKQLNPKFKSLPNEFLYKEVCWGKWSSEKIIKKIEDDFQFYPDDVLVASYPKSGTTVLQEIVWLIVNDINIPIAKQKQLIHRFPFLDENFDHNFEDYNYRGCIVYGAENIPRPRLLKTHLLHRNLKNQIKNTPEMKVLVTIRNPKDTAVSMYHFYRGVIDYGPFQGTWNDFFERWIDGWIVGGDWLDVTLEWWNVRADPNIKLIFFEDIVYKKKEIIQEICDFLNRKLSDSQIDQIIQHTEFKAMKNNPATNFSMAESFQTEFSNNFEFMRKGEVGDWKNYFSKEQNERVDEKYKSVLEQAGLRFQYE